MTNLTDAQPDGPCDRESDPWFHIAEPFVKALRQHGEAIKQGQTSTGKKSYDARTPLYVRINQSRVVQGRSREASPSARPRVRHEALTIAY